MNEQQIFAEARRQAPAALDGFLSAKCAGNEQLQRRVERLLDAVSGNTHLFDRDPASLLKDLTCNAEADSTSTGLNPIASVLESLETSGEPGTLGRLGHYEIEDVVGRGGFGVVLKANDQKLRRPVAIKVLSPALASDAEHRERFLREARSAAAVRHENVVRIYAVEHSPVPYIVMELIEGQTLQRFLADESPLDSAQVIALGIQLAQGLEAAHATGIVHRDIKPANILVETGDVVRIKLTDFGLAYPIDEAEIFSETALLGTPAYMAPEQARGANVDHRSDLFSLGSVMYTMCCGRAAFNESNTMAILESVASDQPVPLGQRNSNIPPSLIAVIERLHQKLPAERYQSTGELLSDLQKLLPQTRSLKTHPAARWRKAASVVGLAIAALGLILSHPDQGAQPALQLPTVTDSSSSKTVEEGLTPKERERQYLAAEQQMYDVIDAMTERNPGFDPRLTDYEITDGRITFFRSHWTPDFSALSALTDLERLELYCISGVGTATDLSFVSGMKNLKILKADGLPLASLAPLKGLPLTELSIWCWNWGGTYADGDLSALYGMPLTRVNLGGSLIQGLEPLRASPIVDLCLNLSTVKDLSPLADMPSLRSLAFADTKVEDITPLAGLKLRELELGNTQVTDISALQNVPLQILSIEELELTDYSALKKLPLLSLRMDYDPIWDSGKLDQLSHVQQLNNQPIAYYKRPELIGEIIIEHLTDLTEKCAVAIKDHDWQSYSVLR